MTKTHKAMIGLVAGCFMTTVALLAGGQNFFAYSNDQAPLYPRDRSFWIFTNREVSHMFTTKAYKKEALRQLVQEANSVAQAMGFKDELPITITNLHGYRVAPYGMRRITGAIGSVTTANHSYYASVDSRFSYLEKNDQDAYIERLSRDYAWPLGRIETNAPYQLATQWIAAVGMDLPKLNRDFMVIVKPIKFISVGSEVRFLPLYEVYWTKGPQFLGSVASVQVFMPTKTLVSLRVEDGDYILRPRLMMTNLVYLLSQTNE